MLPEIKRDSLTIIAVLVVIIAVATYMYYGMARNFEELELSAFPSKKGYVSDEVWYVNSARNILRRIFGLIPRTDSIRATIIFLSRTDLNNAKTLANTYNIKIIADENFFPEMLKEKPGQPIYYAIYVESTSVEDIERFAKSVNAVDVVYGWILGDAKGVHDYLNLEHPPMAKYIIALLIYLAGDSPLVWRIPSIAMGSLIVILAFLLTYEITKIPELGLIAAAAVAVDPLTKAMSSIALLDIYVAAFSMLALYVAVKGRLKEAALALGFASTFKFSALFTAVPLLIIYANRLFKNGLRTLQVVKNSIDYVLLIVLSVVFFQLLVATPIVFRLGFSTWLNQGPFGSIRWHLSVKCEGPGCPISSTPWEWFLGFNSFPLYLSPNIYAEGFTPAYTVCLILMILAIPAMTKERPSRTAWHMLFGTFLGYAILWILGGRSQYSFYAIHLTPLIYIYLTTQLFEFARRENIVEVLSLWKNMLTTLARAVLSLVR